MAPAAQAIRNQEILKTEYSEKAAIGALYDELSKGIESLKKGDVYTVDEATGYMIEGLETVSSLTVHI